MPIVIRSFFNHLHNNQTSANTSNSIHKNHNWLGLVQRTYFRIISSGVYENNVYEIGIIHMIATKTYGTKSLLALFTTNGKNN